jgi:hypothetical protein
MEDFKEKHEQMSFNVDNEGFGDAYQDSQERQEGENSYSMDNPYDGNNTGDGGSSKMGRHRPQGLSISDIPYNVFNPESIPVEGEDLFKQDSFEDHYKETQNFGQANQDQFTLEKNIQSPDRRDMILNDDPEYYNNFLAAHFYGEDNSSI